MTYIVNEKCIKCKLTDCVDVCPVDCFYEGENMLVINPDECIDCGVCEPECPIDAIALDGKINMNECFYCLDCQSLYYDDHRCPPLVIKRKKGAPIITKQKNNIVI